MLKNEWAMIICGKCVGTPTTVVPSVSTPQSEKVTSFSHTILLRTSKINVRGLTAEYMATAIPFLTEETQNSIREYS